MTLTILKGLPGSGKTTYALQQVAKSGGRLKRINKDDLRAMIDGGTWSKERERLIREVRDMLIVRFLSSGYDVIVDDTNFFPDHERHMRNIAENLKANVEVMFLDVPVEECIARDALRDRPVGERVIREMYTMYLKNKEASQLTP